MTLLNHCSTGTLLGKIAEGTVVNVAGTYGFTTTENKLRGDTATHGTAHVQCTCQASPPESQSPPLGDHTIFSLRTRARAESVVVGPSPRWNQASHHGRSGSPAADTHIHRASLNGIEDSHHPGGPDPVRRTRRRGGWVGNVRGAKEMNAVWGGAGRGPPPA
jgi:hypothetical protein